MISDVLELRDTGPILGRVRLGVLRKRNIHDTRRGYLRQMAGKKVTGGESLGSLINGGSKGRPFGLTVGTTALPNLANSGSAGKLIPLSQILAPPVTDPDSGFTSVSVGSGVPSVLGGVIVRTGCFETPNGSEWEATFQGS